MREVLKDAVFIDSVTDLRGEELRVWRTPDGNVIIAGDRGSLLAFTPGSLGELRDLLDRAGMPGQVPTVRRCARCRHVLVDEDGQGWYYQVPVTDPRMPGLTFMDRVHECDGKPHDVRLEERRTKAEAAQAAGTEG